MVHISKCLQCSENAILAKQCASFIAFEQTASIWDTPLKEGHQNLCTKHGCYYEIDYINSFHIAVALRTMPEWCEGQDPIYVASAACV